MTTNDNFLIPLSIENNLIYLFITPSQAGLNSRQVFVLVELRVLKSRGNGYSSRFLDTESFDSVSCSDSILILSFTLTDFHLPCFLNNLSFTPKSVAAEAPPDRKL